MTEETEKIYRHDFMGSQPDSEPLRFANSAPPWRNFSTKIDTDGPFIQRQMPDKQARRGQRFRATEEEARMVDAALVLRRPLLIEGEPGIGKSSLAYSVAWQLGLGQVFTWSITTRSKLQDALYQYDAIGRLQASTPANPASDNQNRVANEKIGDYLTLGPLGSVLVPNGKGPYHPRVLLIDEIDKSDIDLPNDLLHVFEDGFFDIPEIARLRLSESVNIRLHNSSEEYAVPTNGKIVCDDFPLVVLTTNGEREFSPAFKRRCLTLRMRRPDESKLREVMDIHFPDGWENESSNAQLASFLQKIGSGDQVAVDQLLNAVYLTMSQIDVKPENHEIIQQSVLRALTEFGDGENQS
jgi:MoxR-like ATPase